MHLRIRTTDGNVYTTDPTTEEAVVAAGSSLQVVWELYTRVAQNHPQSNYVQVDIGGEVVYFNPANIVFMSIVKPFKFDATTS